MGVPWAKTYHVILLGAAFLFALTYTLLHFDSYLQLLLLVPVPLLVSDIKKVQAFYSGGVNSPVVVVANIAAKTQQIKRLTVVGVVSKYF